MTAAAYHLTEVSDTAGYFEVHQLRRVSQRISYHPMNPMWHMWQCITCVFQMQGYSRIFKATKWCRIFLYFLSCIHISRMVKVTASGFWDQAWYLVQLAHVGTMLDYKYPLPTIVQTPKPPIPTWWPMNSHNIMIYIYIYINMCFIVFLYIVYRFRWYAVVVPAIGCAIYRCL